MNIALVLYNWVLPTLISQSHKKMVTSQYRWAVLSHTRYLKQRIRSVLHRESTHMCTVAFCLYDFYKPYINLTLMTYITLVSYNHYKNLLYHHSNPNKYSK